ncbi:MAG: serine hydrolase domain-containing protein [Bacteroidales bacterium]
MRRKILLSVIAIVVLALGIFLSIPQNHYVTKALRYQKAKIHHYKIFENRAVKAESPEPWKLHQDYNEYTLTPDQEENLNKYRTVAFLMAKDSLLLFEKYWEDYGSDSYSNSFSMAKSFISLLIGCAIDDGYIKSLDQPVADFIPEFSEGDKSKITIRHLLTMSSGLSWDEAYASLFSTTTKAYYGKYLRELVLDQEVVSEPGKEFNYLSGDTQLLSIVLAEATGKSLSEYMSDKIWSKIGAEHDALWSLDKENGIEKAYCCFNTNARDFARIGRLVLNKGNWNGEQLVPKKYLEETLKRTTYLTDKELGGIPTERYGHQWWFTNHKGYNVIFARGILGQYIFIVPELDIVAVRLGHLRSEERIGGQPIDIFAYLDIMMDVNNFTQE